MNIISIQHSGTKLLVRKFQCDELALRDETEGLHVGHISTGQWPHIISRIKDPTIIPMRHPHLVWESWRRRGKNINELIENYHLLIDLDQYQPFYVNIDLPIRDWQIDKINTELNLTLAKEWPIINSVCGTYNIDPYTLNPPTSIKEMAQRYYCRETARRLNGANH